MTLYLSTCHQFTKVNSFSQKDFQQNPYFWKILGSFRRQNSCKNWTSQYSFMKFKENKKKRCKIKLRQLHCCDTYRTTLVNLINQEPEVWSQTSLLAFKIFYSTGWYSGRCSGGSEHCQSSIRCLILKIARNGYNFNW